MLGFFGEALQRKKQIRDSENKVTKTCGKETFVETKKKHLPKKKLTKKVRFFLGARKQRRGISILVQKLQTLKKRKKKSERKRRKDSFKKKEDTKNRNKFKKDEKLET